MNALKCRTLTATCMHASCTQMYMYACSRNIRNIELNYPAPEQYIYW